MQHIFIFTVDSCFGNIDAPVAIAFMGHFIFRIGPVIKITRHIYFFCMGGQTLKNTPCSCGMEPIPSFRRLSGWADSGAIVVVFFCMMVYLVAIPLCNFKASLRPVIATDYTDEHGKNNLYEELII